MLESTCTSKKTMKTIIVVQFIACGYMRDTDKLRIANILITKPDQQFLHEMRPGVASC